MARPLITVIFSSFNGEKRLPRMLASLAAQDVPVGSWELLAVDNNSSDQTLAVFELYRNLLPMTILRHAVPGKSGALNAALERARGELIVFTDDDVRVEPQWLSAFAACADAQTDYDVFGGRITPEWERPPGSEPFLRWIPMGSTFAIVDDVASGPCEPTKIWGPNTMVRRRALSNSRFREDIGPTPGRLFAMGEDQEIVMRLTARGAKAYRCAEAVVHHWIPASSVNETWVQRRAERLGYGIPALFPDRVPRDPRVAGVPLSIWAQSAYWSVRAAAFRILPYSRWRFWAIWRLYYMRGLRLGIRRYAGTSSRGPA